MRRGAVAFQPRGRHIQAEKQQLPQAERDDRTKKASRPLDHSGGFRRPQGLAQRQRPRAILPQPRHRRQPRPTDAQGLFPGRCLGPRCITLRDPSSRPRPQPG